MMEVQSVASSKGSASSSDSKLVELRLDQPFNDSVYSAESWSHVYSPGETIEGELLITDPRYDENDQSLTEINITFEGQIINHITSSYPKELFKMIYTPLYKDRRISFSFQIPERLPGICPHNDELHEVIPPSFGSTTLCSLKFSKSHDPFMCPDSNIDHQHKIYERSIMNRFCVVYFIAAQAIQGDSVMFERKVQVPLKSNLSTLPTNIEETTCGISHHYGTSRVTDDNYLMLVNCVKLESKGSQNILGELSSYAVLPPPISVSSGATTFPVKITLKSIDYQKLKVIMKTSFSAELNQYTIQSDGCVMSTSKPQRLPANLCIDIDPPFKKIVQRVRTVNCNIVNTGDWIPLYEDDCKKSMVLEVTVPKLSDLHFQPTFHTCTLQNIYLIKVKIRIDNESGSKDSNLKGFFKMFGDSTPKNELAIDIPVNLIA